MRFLVFLFVVLSLSSCSSKPKVTPEEMTDEKAFYKAQTLLINEDFEEAAKAYDYVDREFPYSALAPRAMMMAAFSAYLAYEYDDAMFMSERFIQLHPGNKYTPYLYYLKAMCLYAQIADVVRDQKLTEQTRAAFSELVLRYPGSDYAKDAKVKLRLVTDHLAAKEMDIGRHYLFKNQYDAALSRFSSVVQQYQTTSHVYEALYRMVEVYTTLGLKDEAFKTAALLGHNAPNSDWYAKAYQLVKK